MDGLDTYIDDYSVFVPLDAEEARGLVQARAILNPPRMRVNDQGHVEPVPPDESGAARAPAPAARCVRQRAMPTGTMPARRSRPPAESGVGRRSLPRRRGRRRLPVPAPAPAVPEPSAAPPRGALASRSPR